MNVRLSKKGWVVIPAALRAKYGLKPGAALQIVDRGGVLVILPAFQDPIATGAGILKGGSSLTQAIVKDHREEHNREFR